MADHPSDWPDAFHEMKDIDNLLRCPICFEYFNTAMIIPNCSHNYCSLCIRKFLTYKSNCPSCATPVTPPELKNNRTLDDIVSKFLGMRQPLLKALKTSDMQSSHNAGGTPDVNPSPLGDERVGCIDPESIKNQMPVVKHINAPEQKRNKNHTRDRRLNLQSKSSHAEDAGPSGLASSPRQTLGKHTPMKSSVEDFSELTSHSKRKRIKPPIAESNSDDDSDIVVLCENVQDKIETDSKQPRKNISTASHTLLKCSMKSQKKPFHNTIKSSQSSLSGSSEAQPGTSQSSTDAEKHTLLKTPERTEVARVDCPICGVSIREKVINLHLDQCLSRSEKKEALRSTKKQKPMPKLVYNLMSDKEIKRRCKEVGLSTQGNRQALVKRHHEFTILYNAECDSLNPKSASEILKDMEKHEKTKTKLAATGSSQSKLTFDKGAKQEDIEKAQKEYVKKHKSQFDDLIKAAKQRMKSKAKLSGNKKEKLLDTNEQGNEKTNDTKESKATITESKEMGQSSDTHVSDVIETHPDPGNARSDETNEVTLVVGKDTNKQLETALDRNPVENSTNATNTNCLSTVHDIDSASCTKLISPSGNKVITSDAGMSCNSMSEFKPQENCLSSGDSASGSTGDKLDTISIATDDVLDNWIGNTNFSANITDIDKIVNSDMDLKDADDAMLSLSGSISPTFGPRKAEIVKNTTDTELNNGDDDCDETQDFSLSTSPVFGKITQRISQSDQDDTINNVQRSNLFAEDSDNEEELPAKSAGSLMMQVESNQSQIGLENDTAEDISQSGKSTSSTQSESLLQPVDSNILVPETLDDQDYDFTPQFTDTDLDYRSSQVRRSQRNQISTDVIECIPESPVDALFEDKPRQPSKRTRAKRKLESVIDNAEPLRRSQRKRTK